MTDHATAINDSPTTGRELAAALTAASGRNAEQMRAITNPAATNVIRSDGASSNSNDATSLARPDAHAMPATTPAAASQAVSRRIGRITIQRCAPSAMRIPISRVRLETA